MIRRLFILLCVLCASAVNLPSAAARKSLDSVFVPKSGTVVLDGDYDLLQSKRVWGARFTSKNTTQPATVHFHGTQDQSAFTWKDDDTGSVDHVTVLGNRGTYAFGGTNARRMWVRDCDAGGEAGIAKIAGCDDVYLLNVEQLSTSWVYEFYSGPSVLRDRFGNFISERWNGHVKIDQCNWLKGSANDSGERIQAIDFFEQYNCHLADTKEQSAIRADGTRAVAGSVHRLHYVRVAVVSGSTFDGECHTGPLDGNDGGMNMKPGLERDVTLGHVVGKATYTACTFNAPTYHIAAGAYDITYDRCVISGDHTAVLSIYGSYGPRRVADLHLIDTKLLSKETNSVGVGGDISRSTFIGSTINGRPMPAR